MWVINKLLKNPVICYQAFLNKQIFEVIVSKGIIVLQI